MRLPKFAIATTELLLVFPAALFMTAVFVRNLQPPQAEPAHSAQQIVNRFVAQRHFGLWGLLMALPFTVLVSGCITLWLRWSRELELRETVHQTVLAIRTHLSTLLVALATVVAGGVLAIVALHVLSD